MRRRRVCGLENEYCLSIILDDGSFVHDGGVLYANDLSEWFWNTLASEIKRTGDGSFPISEFGMVRDGDSRFWIARTGGLLYADHVGSCPVIEYATPECDHFENACSAEKGGERILYYLGEYVRKSGARYHNRGVRKILFSKNNSDCINGTSVADAQFRGSHDNYQVAAEYMPSDDDFLNPRKQCKNFFEKCCASFLPAQILFSGAGGLCLARANGNWKYYISPRGSITRVVTGMAHDDKRPLFTWKREDDTGERFARLEIVARDSNTHPQAFLWRLGLMAAFLDYIGSRAARKTQLPFLEDPIYAMRLFSSDATLHAKARMSDRRGKWTAVECMREWLTIICTHGGQRSNGRKLSKHLVLAEQARALLENSAGDPDAFSDITDWGLKRALLKEYCRKKNLSFSDWKARRFTVYYSDISPEGIFNRWWAKQAKENSSQCHIPFSEEDMHELVWRHRAAPRAELRKRYLRACFDAGHETRNTWGAFYSVTENRMYYISDPLEGTHADIEKDIRRLRSIAEARKKRE